MNVRMSWHFIGGRRSGMMRAVTLKSADMSTTARRRRFETSRIEGIRKYCWYAVGEILLIFAGITLALWFSNWNEERQLRKVELNVLADIAANLDANVVTINENIAFDNHAIAACERYLDSASRKEIHGESTEKDLYQCKWWTSPLLRSAAYDSLKSRGTDLISDPEIRYAIVDLYEQTYEFLINDMDKTFWSFQTAVMEPVFNRYVRKFEPDRFVPNDYDELLDSNEFTNMVHMKIENQYSSVRRQRETLVETEAVIALIKSRLSARSL
jgi:hypothetical protein